MILSANLSSILQKYKLESTSGMWWAESPRKVTFSPEYRCENYEWRLFKSEFIHAKWSKRVPDPYLSDFIRQSEKVFGKEERYTEENYKESKGLGRVGMTTPNGLSYWEYGIKKQGYKYHSHHITDLLLSSTSQEAIEKYIISNLEER